MLRKMLRKFYDRLPLPGGWSRKRFYEDYWKVDRGSYSYGFIPQACECFEFQSVLDAGSGNGQVVRGFLERGKDAKGIEISSRAIWEHCPDLLEKGRVINGSLTELPFDDNSFDLVFSSEVLEHLTEEDVSQAAKEMVRVAKSNLFMTIALRPSQHNNAYHVTIKPRAWWEDLFCAQGCVVMKDIVNKCQARMPQATTRQIIEAGPAIKFIHELDWFMEDPQVDLKGELEPWFFAFRKV